MTDLLNEQIVQAILQALAYGFLTGFTFYFLPMGVKLVLSLIKTR